MAESNEAIAARCLEDADFARQVLEGDDYPEVRSAIIADLEEEQSVKGYLNPQPMPPADKIFAVSNWANQAQVWGSWSSLGRPNLYRLAYIR
ncbi:MAG: hypothetical protein ACRDJE_20780 [Dehalococcoidia bacterium]